jgi:hypothetical protein
MGTLQFAAFGQDDNRLAGSDIGQVYLATRSGALCCGPLVGGEKGLNVNLAQFLTPPEEGCVLNVHWAMPEFGYLWVQADNGGQTYRLPIGGNTQVWNLNYELARTRALWNSQLEQVTAQQCIALPGDLRQALDRAGSLLHDAMFANHDRRSRLADEALAKALDVSERLAMHIAQTLIHVRRTRSGSPAASVFRLVTPVHMSAALEGAAASRWRAAFDEGTVDFGPAALADSPGSSGPIAAAVEFLEKAGARIRGRSLLPYLDEHNQPLVAESETRLAHWREAAVVTVRKWRGRISTWELLPAQAGLTFTAAHARQIVETAGAVKDACPQVELVFNPGELFAPRMTPVAVEAARMAPGPVGFLRHVLGQCPQIDALAVPLYYPGCDLVQIFRTIDMAADAGRPIHLLMAAAPSQWREDPAAALGRGTPGFARQLGYWRQPWSPAIQAQYAMGIFLMARAHPSVAAVEWSDFSDQGPHVFPFGGLLDAAGKPKALYERLVEARQCDYDLLPRRWSEGLS